MLNAGHSKTNQSAGKRKTRQKRGKGPAFSKTRWCGDGWS